MVVDIVEVDGSSPFNPTMKALEYSRVFLHFAGAYIVDVLGTKVGTGTFSSMCASSALSNKIEPNPVDREIDTGYTLSERMFLFIKNGVVG